MNMRQCAPGLILGLFLIISTGCAQTQTATQPDTEPETEKMLSIGYGEIEKDNATGSVGIMTRDQIEARKVADAGQLFEGRIAGVRVVQTPAGPRLRIRGIHTLQGSKDPLIVLDGTPLPPDPAGLRFLNPNDIDHIEVLKGASAAIYGSRGANGVVLISTRR